MRRLLALLCAVGLLVGLISLPATAANKGADKVPIAGTNLFLSLTPDEVRVTPGGVVHQSGDEATVQWGGDITGETTITYHRSHVTRNGHRLLAVASSHGVLTWDNRTGEVRGVTNATCKADDLGELVCSGTFVLHGSGELEGVTFHVKWGPGFFLFPFEGFALDRAG